MLDSLISDNSNLLNPREKHCLGGLSGGIEISEQTPVSSFIRGGIGQQAIEIPQVAISNNFFVPNGEFLSESTLVEQALESVKDLLTGFGKYPNFINKMNAAFGNSWDAEVASNLVKDWVTGDFSELPKIEIRAGAEIDKANGAFAAANDTIYLSSDFLARNASDTGAVTSVLLEEIGHSIDSKINVSDAAGDEGDIFARVVQGKTISSDELRDLNGEDDHATIAIDGKDISIEMSQIAMTSLNGRLYQSHRGTTNQIYTRSSTDGFNWSTWNSNGDAITPNAPSLASLNGKLYQSHRGFNSKIYTRSSTDGVNWSNWSESSGWQTLDTPALEANPANGKLYQSIRGLNNQIYTRSSSDAINWSNWINNGGAITPSAPSVAVLNGKLYLSHRGLDYKIYTSSSTDGVNWSNWSESSGWQTLDTPALEANPANGKLYQSIRGLNNQIYTRSSSDAINWSNWASNFDGDTPAAPSLAFLNLNGWVYQSRQGTDNQIYTRFSSDGVNWSGWNNNGGGITPKDYEIKANFDSNIPYAVKKVVADAIGTWEALITSGPTSSNLQEGFKVRIYKSTQSGYAGATYAQSGSSDLDVTDSFFTLPYAQQKKVIMHELGHAMGFGHKASPEYWRNVTQLGGIYYFTGYNAKALYGGNIPLQANFDYTGNGWEHWRENDSKLRYELMSAKTEEGYSPSFNDLKYSLAALKDMGFKAVG